MRFLPIFPLTLLLASVSLQAQTSESELTLKLVDKPLFLRGFQSEDKLQFDSAGAPLRHTSTASFTVAGVRIRALHLEANSLHLEGTRECLLFRDNGIFDRVPLEDGRNRIEKLTIDIQNQSGQDFTQALHAIFAESLSELIPSLPQYWQMFAKQNFSQVSSQNEEEDPDAPKAPAFSSTTRKIHEHGAAHVGGNVQPPKVIHFEDPSFTTYARRMSYSGSVVVYLWVEEDGSVSHVSVAKPAGLGLDENAVASVTKYRFKPGTQNGKPVKVDLYVDVNYRLSRR